MARDSSFVRTYFQPDATPSWVVNPGVLVDVRNMVPMPDGTLGNYCATSAENLPLTIMAVKATSEVPVTAKVLKRAGVPAGGNGARFPIGCETSLFEARSDTGVIGDISKSAAPYNACEWTFDIYGDTMLGCPITPLRGQPAQRPQASTGAPGTVCADLGGTPPRASIVVVQKGFIVCYDCYDGTNWYNDAWMCSGLNNPTNWLATLNTAANLATGANTARLLDTPGGVRAAYRMRDGIAVYKDDSIYLGTYTGNPLTWSHRLVSDRVGQASANGVAIVNGIHYFLHRTGVYRFDGANAVNIGIAKVNRFIAQKMAFSQRWYSVGIKACVREDLNLILWYAPGAPEAISGSSNKLRITEAFAYNYATDQWGYVSKPWEEQHYSDRYMGCPVMASKSDLMAWLDTSIDLNSAKLITVGTVGSNMYLRGTRVGTASAGGSSTSEVYTGDIGSETDSQHLSSVKPHLLQAEEDTTTSSCNVDEKASEGANYYHSGLLVSVNGTSLPWSYSAAVYRDASYNDCVIQSGDAIEFECLALDGITDLSANIVLVYTDVTSNSAQLLSFASANQWFAASASLTADAGKTLNEVQFGIVNGVALGTHRVLFRKVRITNGGATRYRIWAGDDRVFSNTQAGLTNATAPQVASVQSLGQAFAYDSVNRKFDGTIDSRWKRVKLAFANKAVLAGLFLDPKQGGK
ncbi:MAG: hypothetical protein IT493_11975 [Gammaproteobacteria bacterium]|nr:hypothetical protein [Gammaproteobacteria bacterium]